MGRYLGCKMNLRDVSPRGNSEKMADPRAKTRSEADENRLFLEERQKGCAQA